METSARETGRRRHFAIVNPHSGKKNGGQLPDRIRDGFARAGGEVDIHLLEEGEDIGDLAAKAAADGYDCVIAAGGDGTISTVAGAVAGTDTALGVIPMGTFNFFARSLELPEDPDEAIRVIATGSPRAVLAGEVNGKLFLNNTSVGIYSAILKEREETYKHWGRSRLAAYWSVLHALVRFYDPMTMRVTVDGRTIRKKTPLAFACASAFQLDTYQLEGAEDVRAGRLALFLSHDVGRWGLVKHAFRLANRRMRKDRDFELVAGEDITIEAGKRSRLVVRDGEKDRMKGPFHIRVLKDELHVIVPDAT